MKLGKQTIKYGKKIYVVSHSSIVGPKEGEGPLGNYFDTILEDDAIHQKSYEKAECLMHLMAVQKACLKLNLVPDQIDVLLGGDLLNQITSSCLMAKKIDAAFLGVYGACSSFAEALLIGSMLIDSDNAEIVSCSSSSHFSTAERQYRYPLELGTQMTPTSQRTVIGSGATILCCRGKGAVITHATMGRIVDMGIVNANNMGAAMAPAAFDTLITHLQDTGRDISYYDLVVTGDLGVYGKQILMHLCDEAEIKTDNIDDCGAMIFEGDKKLKMGGSGAGCCNVVYNGYISQLMKAKKYNRVLFMPTGAMLSKDSSLQGETIPGICYAIAIENEE